MASLTRLAAAAVSCLLVCCIIAVDSAATVAASPAGGDRDQLVDLLAEPEDPAQSTNSLYNYKVMKEAMQQQQQLRKRSDRFDPARLLARLADYKAKNDFLTQRIRMG